MGPKPSQSQTGELFGYPLRDHLNLKHPLILRKRAVIYILNAT